MILTFLDILQVDTARRFTLHQILSHPWTLSQLSRGGVAAPGILTYHHSKENIVEDEDIIIPCETTMLPFIAQLYQEQLEEEIEETGLVSDWGTGEDLEETPVLKVK